MATTHHMRNKAYRHATWCLLLRNALCIWHRPILRNSSASRVTCTGHQLGPATVATSCHGKGGSYRPPRRLAWGRTPVL